MPRVFLSRPNDDEPQRLTTVAARSSDDSIGSLRPARNRDLSVLCNTSTPEELAFQLHENQNQHQSPDATQNQHQRQHQQQRQSQAVSAHSILATNSIGDDDAVTPVLSAPSSMPLRTSAFTQLTSHLLSSSSNGSSTGSSYSDYNCSGGEFSTSGSSSSSLAASSYALPPSVAAPAPPFDRSLIGSPEFDKISVDSMPVALLSSRTGTNITSTMHGINHNHSSSTSSSDIGPSASQRTTVVAVHRTRQSSDLASLQHEMESHAYHTDATPVSESTYLQLRKTLDPEALLLEGNTTTQNQNHAVHGNLRPVVDPFAPLDHEYQGFQQQQRRRAATTGAAPPTHATANRSHRSWTVPTNQRVTTATTTGMPAALLLANDPRGTFRTTTPDTTQQIFAAQQVRLQNKWQTDVWIYMKNAHPFLGIWTAHKWHPYKKKDRVLVLLVTLVLSVFLCGLFATQECCTTSPDSSVAVIDSSRRLSEAPPPPPVPAARVLSEEELHCQPFFATCGASSSSTSLCTLGSSCQNNKCMPTTANASATVCGTNAQCPLGWRCSTSSHKCRPATSLVCYVPEPTTKTSRTVAFALTEDGEETTTAAPTATSSSATGGSGGGDSAPVDAISALANLIEYAKDNNITTDGSTVVIPSTAPPTPTPTPTTTPTATPPTPTATPTPTLSSNATTPRNQTNGASSGSGADATVSPAKTDPTKAPFDVEKLLITLTKPTNGAVYGISSTIPIAWHVKLLEGQRSFVNSLQFRVDFSRDGGTVFDTVVVSDILTDTPASAATDTTQYHYDWQLAQNEALTCTNCVLRVCTQPIDGMDAVCIRTDSGASSTDSGVRSVTAATSSPPKITFHIVREILTCSCGLTRDATCVTVAYLLALVYPVAFLVLEQVVTFYQDSKLFGMFARRGGPKMPVVGFYAAEATTRGRILLSALLLGLVFGCGLLGARITAANFKGSTGEILVLWLVLVLLVLVIGFVYCSLVYCALFTLRWHKDKEATLLGLQQDDQFFADFADFAMAHAQNQQTQFTHQTQQQLSQEESGGLSYQWPPPASNITNSSRSNTSNNSAAVVTQQPGLAMV